MYGRNDARYEEHLAAKHPDWRAVGIGAKIYQADVLILRDIGDAAMGRMINNRWRRRKNVDPWREMKMRGGNQCLSMTGFSQ